MADFQKFLNRAETKATLKKNISEINRLYAEAKREGHENLSLFANFREMFAQVAGSDAKRGIIKLGKASTSAEKAEDLLALSERFLQSKWATSEGREEIFSQSFKTSRQRYNVNKKTWLRSLDILQNDVFSELIELTSMPSDAVFELVKEEQIFNNARRRKGLSNVSLEKAILSVYDKLPNYSKDRPTISDIIEELKKT